MVYGKKRNKKPISTAVVISIGVGLIASLFVVYSLIQFIRKELLDYYEFLDIKGQYSRILPADWKTRTPYYKDSDTLLDVIDVITNDSSREEFEKRYNIKLKEIDFATERIIFSLLHPIEQIKYYPTYFGRGTKPRGMMFVGIQDTPCVPPPRVFLVHVRVIAIVKFVRAEIPHLNRSELANR